MKFKGNVAATLLSMFVLAGVAQARDIKVNNTSGRAIWMTFYGKDQRGDKRSYGCLLAHEQKSFNNIPDGTYFWLAEIKMVGNSCDAHSNIRAIGPWRETRDALKFKDSVGNVDSVW